MDEQQEPPLTTRLAEMDQIREALAFLVPEGKHYESAGQYVNKLLEVAAELPNPLEHLDALKEFLVIYLTAKATENGTTDAVLLAQINARLAPPISPKGTTTHATGPMAWPQVGPHNEPPSAATRRLRYS
ncbi:MAG: hypothetical protein HOQ05_02725 [Corynebacteriales bacterium]|nr:hypothetical protein [Mycobacteriales bacterium]